MSEKKTFVPADRYVVKNPPKPRELGVCGLQFATWELRQFYKHLAAFQYRDRQIFRAAELALCPNHFNHVALTDPALKESALEYLHKTMEMTNHTPSEVSGHAALMALLCPRGVIHSGYEEFMPAGVWAMKNGEPDVEEIRKRTLAEAGRIFEACVYAGVPHFNLFTGSGRVGKEIVQFPHLPIAERSEIIGRDLEVLRELAKIARQAGMKELNIEHHPEQLFHTPEELVEWALLFLLDPELEIFGCKFDVSHLFFTGCYPPDVIRFVTRELQHALEVKHAEKLALARGMDIGRGGGEHAEEEKVKAELAEQARLVFFRKMHAKYGLFRLAGVQSTHSRSELSNPDGTRPNRFGPIDLVSPEVWAETMYALDQHGLPPDAAVMLEHECDATIALTPDTMDVRVNVLFRVAEFAWDYLCMAAPAISHQEAMKGDAG